jgi:simple sugar transport system permease protein
MKKLIKDWFSSKFKPAGTTVLRQAIIVVIALVGATILVYISGFQWDSVFIGMKGAIQEDITGTLRWFSPLLLTGLACAVAFRGGIWNMGVDGQLYMGAITATAVALKCNSIPAPILLPLVILSGMVAGAIWAGIAGLLRIYCGAKEVVTTVLLNYIAFHFTDYMVLGPLKGSGGYAVAESSDLIAENLWLPRLIPGSAVSIGLIFSIVAVILSYFILNVTTFGYENKLIGTNMAFASYGGVNVKRTFFVSIALSGAIAGLAGVIEIIGIHHRFPIRFSSNLGFDGIVVTILANNSAAGVPISGLFFAILRNGSYNIERLSDVPRTLVTVVQALVILMVGAKFVFRNSWHRNKDKENAGPKRLLSFFTRKEKRCE